MAEELKPCPFCKQPVSMHQAMLDERMGYNTRYTIQCLPCQVEMTGMSRKNKNGWADDPKLLGKHDLIKRWNRRT